MVKENGIPYTTEKQVRDEHVIRYHEEDPNRSSRDIETLCKEQGIEISYRTIQRILNNRSPPNKIGIGYGLYMR